MWTRFMDMHSGGGCKEDPYEFIYIEASEDEAKVIFYNKFGHNPYRVTCTCCGEDYSISSEELLSQLTAFDRGCEYAYKDPDGNICEQTEAWQAKKGLKKGYWSGYMEKKSTKYKYPIYQTLARYKKNENVLIIYKKDILPEERVGNVPAQGYIWVD